MVTESSLNWFVYFCSCSKVRKTCWLWQFLTTWDGSCFNIDSHETGWLEYEMWPKLLWIWYRTCETCDMLLIHCIRRLLFLLGSGRTQSVRQKDNCFSFPKKQKLQSCHATANFHGFLLFFLVFHHFSPRLLVPSLWSLSPFFTFWPTLGWRHGAFGNFRCRGARGEPRWITVKLLFWGWDWDHQPYPQEGKGDSCMDSPF